MPSDSRVPEAAADIWGGDRVYPDDSFMFTCHLAGYLDFSARVSAGSVVLDLACGEGYGSSTIAERGGGNMHRAGPGTRADRLLRQELPGGSVHRG